MDDMGWKDISCYGSDFYETPNIDKLAEGGMIFTDAYASCPVCSPSRASIMSGKYPARVGVTDWIGAHTKGKLLEVPYTDHLPVEETSIASALRAGGYRTWHVGKWHLGDSTYYPENHGFDVNIGGNHWGMPHIGYFSPYDLPNLEDGPEGEYLTDRLTDEAIRLIEENDNTPFFLNFWHYAVHTPIQAPEEDIKKFEQKLKDKGLDKINPFIEGENFPCDHKKHLKVVRRTIQSDPVYAALIYNLDKNIGRLIEALNKKGILDNTIIIFTSDNGGLATAEGSPTCNYPLSEGKGWMYEGGVREPLFIKWTGVTKPGSKCSVPVASPDFYPTLLQMAALPLMPEQHADGVSLVPLLEGEKGLDREAIFWHYPHYGNQGGTPGSSVRAGDYKLIEFFEDGRLELYNLKEDIGETKDISKELPERTTYLHNLLKKWREDVEAKIPMPNPDYSKY